jgi:DNA-directed RNA polymerase subunit RPC12/RpoP
MDSWVIVFTAIYPQDVYLAQSLLESEGVATFIKDELTAQVNNFYSTAIGGVKLMVRAEDAPRAVEVLVEGGYISQEDLRKEEPVEIVRTADRTHCPYCGSENISKTKEANPVAILLSYCIGLVLPLFKRTWQCWDCGRHWKFSGKLKIES